MSNKVVFYIGGFNFPDKDAASHRVIANAKILKNLGYTIIFFCMTKEYKDLQQEPILKEVEGFQYYEYKYPVSYKEWYRWLTSIKYIKKIQIKPSIIIAYNYPSLSLYKLRLYTKKNNVKLVADCSEWYHSNNLIKKIDTYFRMKILHSKMDGLILISKFLYNYYSNFECNRLLLPPLVDLNDKKWQRDTIINLKEDNNMIKLVYAGNVGRGEKDDLKFIIESLDKIRYVLQNHIKLNIYGITEKEYCLIYNINESELKNIKEFTSFHGLVAHCAVIQAIKQAHFTIFIRDNNIVNNAGFPTKFVESLSCATPVLTNHNSNISDFIIEGKNGYILDSKTADNFCNSLISIFSNLTLEKINFMKSFCKENNPFDYRQYINIMSDFISLLK